MTEETLKSQDKTKSILVIVVGIFSPIQYILVCGQGKYFWWTLQDRLVLVRFTRSGSTIPALLYNREFHPYHMV